MTLGSGDAPPRAGLSGLEPCSPPVVAAAPSLANVGPGVGRGGRFTCVCSRGGGDLSRLTAAWGGRGREVEVCRLTFDSSAAHTHVPGTSTVKCVPVPTSVVLLLSFFLLTVKHEDAGGNNKEDRDKDKENDGSFQRGKRLPRPLSPPSPVLLNKTF